MLVLGDIRAKGYRYSHEPSFNLPTSASTIEFILSNPMTGLYSRSCYKDFLKCFPQSIPIIVQFFKKRGYGGMHISRYSCIIMRILNTIHTKSGRSSNVLPIRHDEDELPPPFPWLGRLPTKDIHVLQILE